MYCIKLNKKKEKLIEVVRLFCIDTDNYYTVRALSHVGKNFTSSSSNSNKEIENKQTFEKSDVTFFYCCLTYMMGKTLMSALSVESME